MKKTLITYASGLSLLFVPITTACSNNNDGLDTPADSVTMTLSEQYAARAIELTDQALTNYFSADGLVMSRTYNPKSGVRSNEKASIWMYTSSIEAVNAVLHALKEQKANGLTTLYDAHFDRYVKQLADLYDKAEYYKGTYTLTSYTQTRDWTVYAVDRASTKGAADVTGVLNVYDDQMWLVRELIHSYQATGNADYLEQAEYLTAYVLDGWDCTLDANGNQNGGITWGPGYTTKHACSNGPIISPLVWLHEIYKDKSDAITYRMIAPDNSRVEATAPKSDFYLTMAKMVYAWQKGYLLDASTGVYADMLGGCGNNCSVSYETIDGVSYRKNTPLTKAEGTAYSYNSGTMLSGAADLLRATNESDYLTDLRFLTESSFAKFATLGYLKPGYYMMSEAVEFGLWFDCVLMRGYADASKACSEADTCLKAFQDNLDYGYTNYLYQHTLPSSLLLGWSRLDEYNQVEALSAFAFATEYAVLAGLQAGN
jgi:hypothetical protein